jgi:hypothetical protein
MNITVRSAILCLLFCAHLVPSASAQTSASYRLEEHVFNSGGTGTLSSAGFRITLSSIGENAVAFRLTGASYDAGAGFVGRYAPPGEVVGLVFNDHETLSWVANRTADSYQVYRDGSASGYGSCLQSGVNSTSVIDSDDPPGGSGFFYLVTAGNRLGEKGTKGDDSASMARGGATCP